MMSLQTRLLLAASLVLLVFIGIHNSWDTVTYVTIEQIRREREASSRAAAPEATEGDGGGTRIRTGE